MSLKVIKDDGIHDGKGKVCPFRAEATLEQAEHPQEQQQHGNGNEKHH